MSLTASDKRLVSLKKYGGNTMTKKNKKILIMSVICIGVILFSALVGSLVQTAGWTASIKDLRDETNSGVKTITATDEGAAPKDYAVEGKVVSGLLIVPKNATKDTPAPGIVFTHGMYNNREMQLQFGIELARRGFVTLMIDREKHGHNDETSAASGSSLLDAAKYLYNLTDKNGNRIVDADKIAVSGHSFGGMMTNTALGMDGIDTTARGETQGGATDANLSAGKHMGIVSAGLVQACTESNANYGSNLLGVGNIKGNADDLYDNCNTKSPVYTPIARDLVTSVDFANAVKGTYTKDNSDGHLYVKKGSEFKAVTEKDSFRESTQYYRFSTKANCTYYLQSDKAMAYVGLDIQKWTEEQYSVVNGGIYDKNTGTLLQAPEGKKYVSFLNKGKQLADGTNTLRVLYESRNVHTMIPFSTATAAQAADFFYNVYGTPEGARFISPTSQSWWLKEGVACLGILALFGLLLCVVDVLLQTKLFASLAVKEGELPEDPELLRKPKKHVFYWLGGILTAIFGAWCYCSKLDKWYADSFWKALIENTESQLTGITYQSWTTLARLSYWGICVAIFAVCMTAVFWIINRVINMFIHKEDYLEYDEHPFRGLKIRSAGNVFKTLLMSTILVTVFYGIINLLWGLFVVDFRIWTFDFRIFKTDRLLSYMRYVPFFLIFYLVNGLMAQNYRVKDLPEWATIAINVTFNVIAIFIYVWYANSYSMNVGVVVSNANQRNFCYTYPLIPSVAIATVLARRMYVRTGNAWLAALVNATIFTFMCCANNSVGI